MEELPQATDKAKKLAAKLELVKSLEAGVPWKEAAETAGLNTSRSTAYLYYKNFRDGGEKALQDGRQGHPAKLKTAVQAWLVEYCQANPQVTSSQLQPVLQHEFGIHVSVSRLNEVRQALGITRQIPAGTEAKKK